MTPGPEIVALYTAFGCAGLVVTPSQTSLVDPRCRYVPVAVRVKPDDGGGFQVYCTSYTRDVVLGFAAPVASVARSLALKSMQYRATAGCPPTGTPLNAV